VGGVPPLPVDEEDDEGVDIDESDLEDDSAAAMPSKPKRRRLM
jgi:hypothetical protein